MKSLGSLMSSTQMVVNTTAVPKGVLSRLPTMPWRPSVAEAKPSAAIAIGDRHEGS
jgi:hypothetical protein